MGKSKPRQWQGGGFGRDDDAWLELRARHRPVALLGTPEMPVVGVTLTLRDVLPKDGPPREAAVERVMRHDPSRALVALREADGRITIVEWWRP